MYESKDVMVSHPAHYQSETGLFGVLEDDIISVEYC